MEREDVIDLIQWGNEAALTWFATARQTPVVTPTSSSVLGRLTGADLGQSQVGTAGPFLATGSGVLLVAILGIALIVAFSKK